jgi:large subunit ribosomal protein L29
MKTIELNSLTDVELANKLASLKAELFNLRFTHATGSLANSNELVVCKRNIARVKTVMRQRELGLAKAPEAAAKKTTKKTAKVDAEVKG